MNALILSLLVAFVAAEAEPKADPGLAFSGLGLGGGLGYGNFIGQGLGYGYGLPYGLYPYRGQSFQKSYSHILHKREAEADAEPGFAFPGGIGYGLGYGIGHGLGYGLPYGLYPYRGHSIHKSLSHVIHKREAQPEAEPGFGYPGFGLGGGLGYGLGYGFGRGIGFGYGGFPVYG